MDTQKTKLSQFVDTTYSNIEKCNAIISLALEHLSISDYVLGSALDTVLLINNMSLEELGLADSLIKNFNN